MNTDSTKTDTNVVAELFAELETAWNAADGARFGSIFTTDDYFVNVQGLHIHGADAITAGHQAIFSSISKDSKVRYSLVSRNPWPPAFTSE